MTNKGIILAAGKATRLSPLTYDWLKDEIRFPKALIPIHNKPLVEWLLDWFLKNEINDVYIVINKEHKGDFKAWQEDYLGRNKATIRFVVESVPTGTLHPLTWELPHDWFDEPIVMSYGDELKDFDLTKMIKEHFKYRPYITMGIRKVPNSRPYGQVKMNRRVIQCFVKDKNQFVSNWVDAGIYVIDPDVKDYREMLDTGSFSMMEQLYPLLIERKKLNGFKLKGKWQDCGTWNKYEESIKNW